MSAAGLREALRALAEATPAGSAVTFTVPRETLLELVGGQGGNGAAPSPEPRADRLLDAAEAAALLGVAPRWLYRRADRLPFTVRLGRKVRFSEQRLQRHLAVGARKG